MLITNFRSGAYPIFTSFYSGLILGFYLQVMLKSTLQRPTRTKPRTVQSSTSLSHMAESPVTKSSRYHPPRDKRV